MCKPITKGEVINQAILAAALIAIAMGMGRAAAAQEVIDATADG